MRIGFTGTQDGMTAKQQESLRWMLTELFERAGRFHHGDCIGADAEAHDIAHEEGLVIIIHPPVDDRKRAHKHAIDINIKQPKPYLDRNKDIVEETELLIAAPAQPTEQLRSGTWSTVRYARAHRRDVHIIRPDGTVLSLRGTL